MAKETTKTTDSKEVVDHVRMVTEADMTADPRLMDAGVSVGMLYDFSNLNVLPKDASFASEEVEARNEAKANASTSTVNVDEQVKALEEDGSAASLVAARELKIRQAMTDAGEEATK